MINLQFFKVIKNHIINTLHQFYNEWKDSDLEIWINLCCISRVYIESLFGAKDQGFASCRNFCEYVNSIKTYYFLIKRSSLIRVIHEFNLQQIDSKRAMI